MWRGVDGWESVERCGTLSMLCGYVIYGNKEVVAVHTRWSEKEGVQNYLLDPWC